MGSRKRSDNLELRMTVRSIRRVTPVFPKLYFGAGAPGHQAENFIKTLAYRVQGSRFGEFLFSCSSGRVPYLAIPDSFGTPTFRIAGSILPGGMSLVWTGSVTDANTGLVSTYNLWEGNQRGLGSFLIKVS